MKNRVESAMRSGPAWRAGGVANRSRAALIGLHHSLGNAALLRLLQARLSVSQPDDPYEQESERVADAVTRTPAPMPNPATDPARDRAPVQVRCACPACAPELEGQARPEEEELLQTRALAPADSIQRQAPLEEDEPPLAAKAAAGTLAREALPEEEPLARRAAGIDADGAVSDEVETALAGLGGHGQPLPEPVRADLEPRLGADFSAVRVHTDAAAHDLARAVHAEAFTLGTEVVFGAGRFQPTTNEGQRLLAHELTHVVQQGEAGPRSEAGLLNRAALVEPSPWSGASAVPLVQRSPLPPPPRQPSQLTAASRIGQHVALVRRAVERLSVLAGPGTFGPAIVPVLQRLVGGLTYRFGNTDYFGTSLEVGIRGRRDPFHLRLVLDDKPDPWERGYFQGNGNAGSIALNLNASASERGAPPLVQRSVDEVAALLHHEAIHMFRYWQALPGARPPFSGGMKFALDLGAARGLLPLLGTNLRTILREVNPARRARGAGEVPEARATEFAEHLAEEAMVRGETSYMATLGGQREQLRRGSPVILGGREFSVLERAGGVVRYLFESGSLLDRADERALGDEGRRALAAVGRVLEEIEQMHHRIRWGGRGDVAPFP